MARNALHASGHMFRGSSTEWTNCLMGPYMAAHSEAMQENFWVLLPLIARFSSNKTFKWGHLPCSRENEMIHVTMQKLPNIQMFVHILQEMVQDNHRCSLKHTVHVVMTKCAAWSKQRSLQQCFVRQQCFLGECDSYGLFPFLEFLLAACVNSTGQPPI